jgi:hypothetical protein
MFAGTLLTDICSIHDGPKVLEQIKDVNKNHNT